MIALRLRYAREQAALEQARETAEGRRLIRAETRTLTRRQGETVLSYRISLDERQVLLRWGNDPQALRQQRLGPSPTTLAVQPRRRGPRCLFRPARQVSATGVYRCQHSVTRYNRFITNNNL